MRAFGPGSVSSFLKTVLDVVYALLWVLAAALAVGAAALALALPFGVGAHGPLTAPLSALADLDRRGPETLGTVVFAALYLAALIVTCDRLRRVFATLIAGDPFDPGNVRRMRVIGLALIVLELAAYALRYAASGLLGRGVRFGVDLNLTAWFAILVVFVLAEVFREGARLRAEAEFTV